jgi:hypothetical protein
MYNMDISTCDTSHGPAVFKALIDLVPPHVRRDMERLVAQCAKPARIVSQDRRHTILLKPNGPVLYSGATITTAINNVANIAIAVAITSSTEHPVLAARRAGYVVTLQDCQIPEDLQFLKTSPVFDTNGDMQPFLNLGVLLRLSGACKGDLPGRGPIEPRARKFQGALLNGYNTHYQCDLLTQLRRRFPMIGEMDSDLYSDKMKTDGVRYFEMSSIFKRYRLTFDEEKEVMAFGTMDFGQIIGNQGLGKILSTDYGVTCNSVHLGGDSTYRQY